jgi:hypothetical protein
MVADLQPQQHNSAYFRMKAKHNSESLVSKAPPQQRTSVEAPIAEAHQIMFPPMPLIPKHLEVGPGNTLVYVFTLVFVWERMRKIMHVEGGRRNMVDIVI